LATSILLLIVIGYFIMHPHAWAEEMADKAEMGVKELSGELVWVEDMLDAWQHLRRAYLCQGSSSLLPSQAEPLTEVTLSRVTPWLTNSSMVEQGTWVMRRSSSSPSPIPAFNSSGVTS